MNISKERKRVKDKELDLIWICAYHLHLDFWQLYKCFSTEEKGKFKNQWLQKNHNKKLEKEHEAKLEQIAGFITKYIKTGAKQCP